MSDELHAQAGSFLLALKKEENFDKYISFFSNVSSECLHKELNGDKLKLVFWINLYNAYFLVLRKHQNLNKPEIFRDRLIHFGQEKISLDEIEHGILRRFRWKYSLGYLPNPFTRSIIKEWAVDRIDYRIHFALNCGAESCPPIAFYHHDKIERQLDMATISYLESETKKNEAEKTIYISQLFKWFKADFGGNKGIRKILQEKIQMDSEGYALAYSRYSWDENLENWT